MKKQTKSIKYGVIAVVAVLFIFNFTPLSYLLHEHYTYRNYDNSFTFSEENGGNADYQWARNKYAYFLKTNPEKAKTDPTLYRTFTIQPWRFWEWREFLFCPQRFRLPYKAP